MKKLLFAAVLGLQAAYLPAAWVINEVDSDSPGTDLAEFIEIKGDPLTAVDGLAIVLFNGGNGNLNPPSYYAVNLTGSTDANGYFVLGMAGVPTADQVLPSITGTGTIQQGEDAVALYQASASSFPNGTLITTTNLLDYVVYETGADANATWTAFGGPTTVYDEALGGNPENNSLSRSPDGTGTTFLTQLASPGVANPAPNPSAARLTPLEKIDFGRFNRATAAVVSTATLTNAGGVPMTVSAFGLTGDPEFSVQNAPALPATLGPGEFVELLVQFVNNDTTANKVFNGTVTYTSNATTSATGSIPVRAEFVKVATAATTSGTIVINEISYDPDGGAAFGGVQDYKGDGVFGPAADEEFLELYNTTPSPIDISGWEVRSITGSSGALRRSVLPAGTVIPANGFIVGFGAEPAGFPPNVAGAWVPAMNNAGASMDIGDGVTIVDAIEFADAEESPDVDGYTNLGLLSDGGSIGRRPNGTGAFRVFNHQDVDLQERPTPGASNNGASLVSDWQLF